MVKKKELITAQALADSLDLSVETIWRYTRNRRIPFVELGSRQYRYRLRDVMAALSGQVGEISGGYRGNLPGYGLALHDENGVTYEVLAGKLSQDPAPSVAHQRAKSALLLILTRYFRQIDPRGEVFVGPLDLCLPDSTVVRPDIFFVSGTQLDIVQEESVSGVPNLIVEIVSRSGRARDRVTKMAIYQNAGVQHYWLFDCQERTLECYSLQGPVYARVAAGMAGDQVEHPDFAGLSIPLD